MLDLVIRNGWIIDGTGRKAFLGDVGVHAGRIAWVCERTAGKELRKEELPAEINRKNLCVIDAAGLVVCPGFIDVHSHNDLVPLMVSQLQQLKLHQGVTTELVGQCGLGVVPCVDKDVLWRNYTRGVVGEPEYGWSFENASDYFHQLESCGVRNNFAMLVSHGAVRASVMGLDTGVPTAAQLEEMCRLVEDAMKAGAFGMSLGLQYMPGIFSGREELVRLCSVVSRYDGVVMVHLRNHDSSIIAAMEEIVSIAKEAGVRLHLSHLRSYASEEYGCNAAQLLKAVDAAVAMGVAITFDEHLYLSGSTLLTQLLPPWVSEGGQQMMLERLRSDEARARIRQELGDATLHYKGWDNYYGVTGWENVLITSVKNEHNLDCIGKTLGQLAASTGEEPLDFMARLIVEEQGGVGIVTRNVFSEQDTMELIKCPLQMVGSDSIPAGTPHPRLYGNYPLFFGKYVRDLGALSLEEAVQKCTQLPARLLGLADRGVLASGNMADIVMFDYDKIKGFEDYENPRTPPVGITHVVLGGKIAMENGVVKGEKAGSVLRKVNILA